MGSGLSGNYKNTKGSLKPEHLMEKLRNSGVKFIEKEVVMVTETRKGELVWLELGNYKSGLQHILDRHEVHIHSKFGISHNDIPNFIKDVFQNGVELSSRLKNTGYEKVYEYKGEEIVITGIGTNGYIVSVYPGGE